MLSEIVYTAVVASFGAVISSASVSRHVQRYAEEMPLEVKVVHLQLPCHAVEGEPEPPPRSE